MLLAQLSDPLWCWAWHRSFTGTCRLANLARQGPETYSHRARTASSIESVSANISNSVSTGGAGTVLEHRYAASWVALLLCHGEPPFFPGARITEVVVQAGSLFWKTDDVLVHGGLSDGLTFKVAAQVKRTCSPVESDDDFASFITGAWTDFHAIGRFNRGTDRLLLVSGFQSAGLYRFRQLIEQARANPTAADWLKKLHIPKYLSKEVAAAKDVVAVIVTKTGTVPTDEQLWDFLRHCGVVLTDLGDTGGSHEAQILSLLRTTCVDTPPEARAADTWNELCTLTAVGEGVAMTFRLADLPESLRRRHSRARTVDLQLLADMRRNSDMVIAGCRDTIKGVALDRTALEADIADALAANRVVLLTGPAGSGKSALAKRIFRTVTQDAFALAFRVEEFAATNLRASPAMHGSDLGKLLELSALFGKRVVLIESVERLLEDTRRDAFLDFLRQLAGDPTWHLILTCRSSARVTVEQAFLKQAGLSAVERSVPPFTDAELKQFTTSLPQLMRPLSSPPLRELLRQPFLLEKAAALSWPESEPLPTSEREFRRKVWTEVIRNDDLTVRGLPQRRAEAFGQIALRRAKELAPYVRATGLDAEAVQKLCDDGLVVRADRTAALVAPAHDVLEDWALLQWLDEEFQLKETKLLPLVESLEPFPALRRAFRKWLLEQIDAAPALAGKNIIAVIRAPALAQQWRDEIIATVLRSSQAGEFVRHSAAELLADNGALLFRCLHLCRVAATGQSQTLPTALGRLSMARVPDGSGWIAMAELLSTHLALVITAAQVNQVAHFVSDWCRGVSAATPYPEGAAFFARIALGLLKRGAARYRVSPAERMLAESVLKIPLAEKVELVRQIRHALAHDRRFHRNGGGLQELALNFTHGATLARDLPELVIECQTAYLTAEPVNKHDPWARHHRREVAEYFGLPPFLPLEDATASALRGPSLHLLFAHPTTGLDAIIAIINRAAQSYAETSAEGGDGLEPPKEVEIELPDGTRKKIFGGWRLWAMYRGASVAPYVLQSALMALEAWLLGKAEQKDLGLSDILQKIVLQSNNVALLAVVASVAVAHPELSGVAAYCVLTHPSFYHLDIARMTHESAALETMFGGFSLRGDLDKRLAVEERRASRKRAHRRRTVEDLSRALQSTGLQARVWALLDRFRLEAGGAKPADTDMATWLNIIHRMDLREFRHVARKDGHDYFSPGPLPAGVEEKLAPVRPAIEANDLAMSLLNWGIAAFKRDLKPAQEIQWREMLAKALAVPLTIEEEHSFAPAGATHVCVAVLRDHAPELTKEEASGCEDRVVFEILKHAGTKSDLLMCQNHEMNGDRPAAYVASTLLRRSSEDPDLRRLVAIALTHPVEQVRFFAAAGYREAFADSPEVFRPLLAAFAAGAKRYAELEQAEDAKDWQQRRDSVETLTESLAHTRELIESTKTSDIKLVETLRYDETGSHLFVGTVASWLSQRTDWPEASAFFTLNTARLVARMLDTDAATDRHSETEQVFEHALAVFALSLPVDRGLALLRPVAEAARKQSHDVSMFFWSLAIQAERLGRANEFWVLWEEFARVALTLPAADYQNEDNLHRDLLSRLFLHLDGEVEPDWPMILGREATLAKFYAALPAAADITGFYLQYLNRYGRSSLPAAFVAIAHKIAADPTGGHLSANNLFLLEQMLTPRVFGTPQELKSDPEVRAAVIAILDALVDAGSAAAYLMRDDFATPLPAAT
jgi:hypothetical protein